MAPAVKITPAILASVVPSQTLADLSDSHDLENDLQVLIHWLSPYYLNPHEVAQEPSARVKAAAKRCLRDKVVHQDFVRLYCNSVEKEFYSGFRPFVEASSFSDIVDHVASLHTFYFRQMSMLNISQQASALFSRGLTSLFLRYLKQPPFLNQLRSALNASYSAKSRSQFQTLAVIGMKPAIEEIVVSICAARIRQQVSDICFKVWNEPVFNKVEEWVRVDLYPIFALGCVDLTPASSNHLVRIAREELVRLRTSEIFDMVLHLPRTKVALDELHQCLSLESDNHAAQSNNRAMLVESFIQECHSRSLHSGSNTVSVISIYMNTIKAFLLVDPTGVLLDKVARPIRKYLKSRADLVQQLVRGMLEPDASTNPLVELARELSKDKPPIAAPIDDLTDLNWCPDPIDALPDFKKGKVLDVVENLTSIFSSSSVFVDEFTKLFGERLLQWDKYSTDEILAHVELLKKRFGANEFAILDVMVRDIQESAVIHSQLPHEQFSLTILSKIYWPTVSESLSENDYFEVPVGTDFEAFSKFFRGLKPGRDLALIPSLGIVSVELICDGNTQDFEVTPAQAAVIEIFHDDMDELSLQTVTLTTRLSAYAATQALRFWVNKGILSVSGDVYKAVYS